MKMFSPDRSHSVVQGVKVSLSGGETHHVLIIIPLLSWNPRVRVAVPDSEFHGAAEGTCSWRRESRRACVNGQRKRTVSISNLGSTICPWLCVLN